MMYAKNMIRNSNTNTMRYDLGGLLFLTVHKTIIFQNYDCIFSNANVTFSI